MLINWKGGHTLQLLTTAYHDKSTYIFTNWFNVLYLLSAQIKHPTLHNSHLDKINLESLVLVLHSHTQFTTFHKVRPPFVGASIRSAHASIDGNEQSNTLAKQGRKLYHSNARASYEYVHPTQYYLQKRLVALNARIPYKGPIKHLENILKYDNRQPSNHNKPNTPTTQMVWKHGYWLSISKWLLENLCYPKQAKNMPHQICTINIWATLEKNLFCK